MAGLQLLDGSLDVLHATLLTHLIGGEVGVQTGTVPVTGHGLGCHRDASTKGLSHAVEEETGDPELVTHCNTLARTDLELPLGGHDLGVGAGDVDTSVQACLVVRLDDVTLDDLAGTDTAVVRALRSGETVGGLWKTRKAHLVSIAPFDLQNEGPTWGTYPAEWPVVEVEQGVLLLETEPGLVGGVLLHQLGSLVSVVELVGCAIGHPALGQDENVVAALGAERVGVDSDGLQVDVAVVTRGLAGGGTVEVPL